MDRDKGDISDVENGTSERRRRDEWIEDEGRMSGDRM
jgi:hypothetical protein